MVDLTETKFLYTKTDFYYETPIINRTFLSFLKDRNPGFSADDNYVIVEKRHEFKPFVLSYDLYGSNEFYWVFQRMNMDILIDPIRDLREGVVLRVPTPDRIRNFLT